MRRSVVLILPPQLVFTGIDYLLVLTSSYQQLFILNKCYQMGASLGERVGAGSAKANRRKPITCLGRASTIN
jgi:hypothetical protein